jgi:8-oxo-dGTP pyrophosphatase MutT (NUDIX family)
MDTEGRKPGKGKPGRRRQQRSRKQAVRGGGSLPDILYHASDVDAAGVARDRGSLSFGDRKSVFMSRAEGQAWLISHRNNAEPLVLYVDASRARQSGVKFQRNGRGLWQAEAIPSKHILNLQTGFRHQLSAGGFPVFYGSEGPEIALIRVKRRFGATWEIAKGKLEDGEYPIQCAKRELQEEMGAEMNLEVEYDFGYVRFGFLTPEGYPRLKTLYVYQFKTDKRIENFKPAEGESIVDVGWFTPKQVDRLVSHRSLRPLVRLLLQNLER